MNRSGGPTHKQQAHYELNFAQHEVPAAEHGRRLTNSFTRSGTKLLPQKRQSSRHGVRHMSPLRQNYGTMANSSTMYRSHSMPVRLSRVVIDRRSSRHLTVAQQSAKLAEEAKRNFFHGSFSSSHGAIFTMPNRAQQMASARPIRAPSTSGRVPARTGSVSRRGMHSQNSHANDNSYVLWGGPLPPSALKENKSSAYDFLSGPIEVKARSSSAEPRLQWDGDTGPREVRQSAPRLKDIFRKSSPDLVALQSLQGADSASASRMPLSPVTIARAAAALRMFEERKVPLPTESFGSHREVLAGDKVIPVPEASPLILVKPGADKRRVQLVEEVQAVSDEEEAEDYFSEEQDVQISIGGALLDLLYLGIPAAISICFTFSMSVIPLAFVGNYLGELELTGASVAYFLASILVMYPMIGLTFAMDTLCSHEFGRDPLSPEMGLVLQRGIFINLLVLIPLCLLLRHLDGVLAMVYGAAVAEVSKEFLTYIPLYLLPAMVFIAFNKFLNNQMQPHLPMIALTAGVIITPLLQMQLTPLGVRYTMIGMAITAWLQLLIVVVLTLFKPETRMTLGTWRLQDALEWSDVKEYMTLAIPSAIFVAAEASSFDLTVLLCARYSETDGAAWSSIMNSLFIFASLSGGLSASACANIGRCIGANMAKSAKRFVHISIACAFVIGVVDSMVLVVFFDFLMSFFGTTGKTLLRARSVLVYLVLFHISDSVQFAFQGIFSGLGKNHLGAAILLAGLWGVGVPLAILLGEYLDYRMYGVCVGITVGLCIEAPAMVIAAYKLNYQEICDALIEYEDDEASDEYDEEDEESELDEEYVEEVMKRSGIHTSSEKFSHEYIANYQKLMPPPARRRHRHHYVDDEGS